MLEYMYEWIENIACYLMIVTAVMHMIPGESYKKYIKFFIGLILILMLAKPILMIGNVSETLTLEYEKWMENMKEVIEDSEPKAKEMDLDDANWRLACCDYHANTSDKRYRRICTGRGVETEKHLGANGAGGKC